MRSRISIIILLISIILLIFAMVSGITIGNIEIMSISQFKEKDKALSQKIEQAKQVTSVDYAENKEKLQQTYEKYLSQKTKYEKLSGGNNDNSGKYETKKYDISYLWRILGNYANNRKLGLGIKVTQSEDSKKDIYNLNFTVSASSGQYSNVIKFIEDIEEDSNLYFRIYDFKMVPVESGLQATFTVKNVNIEASTIK